MNSFELTFDILLSARGRRIHSAGCCGILLGRGGGMLCLDCMEFFCLMTDLIDSIKSGILSYVISGIRLN